MFRGIVEGTGRIAARTPSAMGVRLVVELPAIAAELMVGQSVAINGVCLTAIAIDGAAVAFDLAGETLRRTRFGELTPGAPVNYERAMRLEDRLDGHLVQGHVDGCGVVRSFDQRHDDHWLVIDTPCELLAQMVSKGSIAVDGIALTIAELTASAFACTIIPHTRALTHLATLRAGERVHLECDVLVKWLAQLHARSVPPR